MEHNLAVYLEHPWRRVGGNWQTTAVLMVEGVHAGSFGPLYWAPHVLAAAAPLWNNVPLTLEHPMLDGRNVGINHSPAIRGRYEIGKVLNGRYDPAKKGIRADLQVPQNHPKWDLVKNLREISVGIFSTEQYGIGEWNGEGYLACALSQVPDHCAILTGTGACAVADGCGVGVNSPTNQQYEGGTTMTQEILAPVGVYQTKAEDDLQTMEQEIEEAEARGILVPAELKMNVMHQKAKEQEEGGDYLGRGERVQTSGAGDVLAPAGVTR
jgi:hypothetical protein